VSGNKLFPPPSSESETRNRKFSFPLQPDQLILRSSGAEDVNIAMKRQRPPLSVLLAWSKLNGVELHGVEVQHIGGNPVDKGSAVVASQDLKGRLGCGSPEVLIRIPRDLILSAEMVAGWAKVDGCLREVLMAVGDFGKVGACLALHQSSAFPRTVARLSMM
jgi:hypothetical protein